MSIPFITLEEHLTSQLISLLLAHRIISHTHTQTHTDPHPYPGYAYFRHPTPTHPGFFLPPGIMQKLITTIIDKWVFDGLTDMCELRPVAGEERWAVVERLVDGLLGEWVDGEGRLKVEDEDEVETEVEEEEEEEEEDEGEMLWGTRVDRAPPRGSSRSGGDVKGKKRAVDVKGKGRARY